MSHVSSWSQVLCLLKWRTALILRKMKSRNFLYHYSHFLTFFVIRKSVEILKQTSVSLVEVNFEEKEERTGYCVCCLSYRDTPSKTDKHFLPMINICIRWKAELVFEPGSVNMNYFEFLLSIISQIPHISCKRLLIKYVNYVVKARASQNKVVTLLVLILYAYFKWDLKWAEFQSDLSYHF